MILFLIILLSVVMVVDCAVLVFLVLMQLPKKEAGAGGLAFGGAATDALFGAGSGNFLTKATKYAAGLFFALAILLGVIESWRAHQPGSDFLESVKRHQNEQPTIAAPAPTMPPPAPSQPAATAPGTNLLIAPAADSLPKTVSSNAAPASTTQ